MPGGRGASGGTTTSERYMTALAASLKSCSAQVGRARERTHMRSIACGELPCAV